jgi:hypothetical protein
MRIHVRQDARSRYVRSFAGAERSPAVNWEWADTLDQVAGEWLQVELEYVFRDQYNTPPRPGVSENGLRIMRNSVDEEDYEGDEVLRSVLASMRDSGVGWCCHSVRYKEGLVVDGLLPDGRRVDLAPIADVFPGADAPDDTEELRETATTLGHLLDGTHELREATARRLMREENGEGWRETVQRTCSQG